MQVSPEFRSLCQQEMELTLSALQASLLAAAASSRDSSGAAAGEDGKDSLPVDLITGTTLSCALYARAAHSIQSGQLECRLVAHSSGGATGGGSSGGNGAGNGRPADQQLLLLGRGPYSLEDDEQWIVGQSIIVLPDSGAWQGGCGAGRAHETRVWRAGGSCMPWGALPLYVCKSAKPPSLKGPVPRSCCCLHRGLGAATGVQRLPAGPAGGGARQPGTARAQRRAAAAAGLHVAGAAGVSGTFRAA